MAANPFVRLERDEATAFLAATGSRDPDLLRRRARALVRGLRLPRLLGAGTIGLGAVLLAWWPAGLVPGSACALLGSALWRRATRNVRVVERAYDALVKTPEA